MVQVWLSSGVVFFGAEKQAAPGRDPNPPPQGSFELADPSIKSEPLDRAFRVVDARGEGSM